MNMAQTRQAGIYEASAFERKLLLAFHGAADTIKAGMCTMLGVGFDEGYDQERYRGSKRPLESAAEDGPTAKRSRASDISAEAKPVDFCRIQSPRSKIDCLIQVNLSEGAGSLAPRSDGHGVKVFLDGGGSGSATIGLQFKYPGSDGKVVARVNWQLEDRLLDQWIIQNFEYVLVKNAPEDKAINYKKALSQCGEDDAMQRLMCITLRLVPQAAGFCSSTSLLDTSQATKTCLNAIFRGKKDFTLRIWFLVPVLHFDLDKDCLSIMQYLFNRRQEPLGSIQDAYGVHFAELRKDPGAVVSQSMSGAISTRNGSQTDIKSEEAKVKIEPLEDDFVEDPASGQGMTTRLPTLSTDEARAEPSLDGHTSMTVPRVGPGLESVKAHAETEAQSHPTAEFGDAASIGSSSGTRQDTVIGSADRIPLIKKEPMLIETELSIEGPMAFASASAGLHESDEEEGYIRED